MKSLHQIKTVALAFFVIGLSACSSMIPYEEEFACNRPDNMGKCVSTEEAYLEATTGESIAPYAKPESQLESGESNYARSGSQAGTNVTTGTTPVLHHASGYHQYLDANYREAAKLLDGGITPVTTSGDTLKIVLAPNLVGPKIMVSERVMYIIIEEPEFLMGDYLKPKKVSVGTPFGD